MKVILGLIVIIATLVIAGRQPANAFGKVLSILFIGFMVFSLVVQIPDADDHVTHDKEYYAQRYYDSKPSYRKPALTAEEADALRGTGYKNTKPGSFAEIHELEAAQVKCKECGLHTDNGVNSLCDYCQKHGK